MVKFVNNVMIKKIDSLTQILQNASVNHTITKTHRINVLYVIFTSYVYIANLMILLFVQNVIHLKIDKVILKMESVYVQKDFMMTLKETVWNVPEIYLIVKNALKMEVNVKSVKIKTILILFHKTENAYAIKDGY
jgi:hypothetical protein